MTERPAGQITSLEYQTTMSDGAPGYIVFTLGDLDADTEPARIARAAGAVRYGLVSITGLADAPRHPVIWIRTSTELNLVPHDGDPQLADDLQVMLANQFVVFFKDIEAIAPDLSALGLLAEPKGNA
jgi:hypothetical protein